MIDFSIISSALPHLLHGAKISLQITLVSCSIGITLGTLLGLLQAGKNKFLKSLVTLYVTIIRGTPMLIQIIGFFYIFPALGINFTAFWIAAVAIGLNSAAYISQTIRSGILSVSQGTIEAAQVLGLSHWQITQFIILPQAIRVVLPALGNEFITLLKDSSLASVIGVQELSKEGTLLMNTTYDAITSFAAVGFIYLLMTTTLSLFLNYLEKRMNHHALN
ncbi:MAG: amino acid ABC transporter permease [Candidatus Babeliales bacterium]